MLSVHWYGAQNVAYLSRRVPMEAVAVAAAAAAVAAAVDAAATAVVDHATTASIVDHAGR